MIGTIYQRAASRLAWILLLAASGVADAAEVAPIEPIGAWEIARVSGSLLVVVAVIVATAAGLKRLKSLHTAAGSHLKIIDGVSVSTRDRIVLLEVGDERILVGVSPGRIQALHVLAREHEARKGFADLIDSAAGELQAAEAHR